MTDQALVELAFTMLDRAYVPYSRFPVGAALLCAGGTVFTGCNVENAAYGSTICDYCWPCGACRQMLFEFAPDLTVLVARGDHEFVTLPLRELLPHGFGPSSLD